MDPNLLQAVPKFMEVLGFIEMPMGVYYTDVPPDDGIHPKPGILPTRQREIDNQIDWQAVFTDFNCVMSCIWRARRKQTMAWFSARHFGCPGGAFWLGFMKPQTETIIHYVSTGIPGGPAGEYYCESPDALRRLFDIIDPEPASGDYCVFKPLSMFDTVQAPEFVVFFGRPESMAGLHQLATFVTNDPEVVASPWGAACTGLITWPRKYLKNGQQRAVIGGWDPSARKFFKTDELFFCLPSDMFVSMIQGYEQSFLMTKTWSTVQKKIQRSQKVWGEISS